jgi:hypothetical protein
LDRALARTPTGDDGLGPACLEIITKVVGVVARSAIRRLRRPWFGLEFEEAHPGTLDRAFRPERRRGLEILQVLEGFGLICITSRCFGS